MKIYRILGILGLIFIMTVVSACNGSTNEPTTDQAATEEVQTADSGNESEQVVETPVEETYTSEEGDLVFSDFSAQKIDPAIASGDDPDLLTVSGQIYSRLLEMVDGEIVPGLATNWSVSDDGLTYEFQLRPDAVFTDGTKVTSDVILANFNRWFDPENPLHGDNNDLYVAWKQKFEGFRGEVTTDEAPISKFDGIEKVDNLVFLIHLIVPMDNFIEVITGPEFSILNPILMASEGVNHATMAGSVVGTGEYQVAAWDENGLTLILNDTYWGN